MLPSTWHDLSSNPAKVPNFNFAKILDNNKRIG